MIGFYGDSTIRGYKSHSGDQTALSTPQAFETAVALSGCYTILNEGADSSRIEHLLSGEDGKHPRWDTYLTKAKVDIVITNHASKNGNPVSQYESDMTEFVSIARKHKKVVIFMTPNPIAEGGLDAYVDAMRRVASVHKVPLIDVDKHLKSYMERTGQRIADVVPDGYHPSDAMYVLIGRYAAQEFLKIEHHSSRLTKRR